MRGGRSSSPKSVLKMNGKSMFNSKTLYIFLGLVFVCFVVYVFVKPIEYFENSVSKKSLEYFYMEGCPHCEAFDEVWKDSVAAIAKEYNIKSTELESNSVINMKKLSGDTPRAKELKVTSFPTVLYTDTSSEEYKDGRNVESILKYIKCKINPESCK